MPISITAAKPRPAPPRLGRRVIALRDGLTAHCSDTVHAHQGQQLLEPHLDLVLMLEGEADVHYGRQPFHFGMQRTRSGMRHEAVLISVAEPDVF
ncbi:MAG TPA: hypothetical protein VLC08_07930, partial [Chitinolyticbacter sp.]|nr:hypothetical protein [Chitinolyticbacter sp.]